MPKHSSLKLFVAPGCPHCSGMIRLLSDMLKNGKIAQLEMINTGVNPVAATEYNIRSVPTLLIGEAGSTITQSNNTFNNNVMDIELN